MLKLVRRAGFGLLLLVANSMAAEPAHERIPLAAQARAERGESVDLLVRIVEDSTLLPSARRQASLSRPQMHRAIKEQMLTAIAGSDLERLKRYDQLPMLAVRVRSAAALQRLAARSEVLEVYENVFLYPVLAQSLPLIGQPAAAAAGQLGSGTAIAVVDTGVDYTKAPFGGCTAPGSPAGCKVAAAMDFAPDDGALDANGHGSMVAAIVSATAPGASILALDVFDGASASSIDVVEAIDWVIANRDTYKIAAINLSLGGSAKYTAPCASGNPFRVPLQEARAAGIVSFVASGNSAYSDGLSMPACTPEAVSVGATYDANVGALGWSGCSDSTTAADKVACFSNGASFLKLLAPGALITVLGSSGGGTSFAAPHAAGAHAVLRAARPAETAEASLARLSTFGTPVSDSRNGIVTPRINLAAALQLPGNDAFASALPLSGASGSTSGRSELSTAESGEPSHAGVSPVRSLWWTWTAPSGGDAVFRTTGSSFDTALAAYTGSTLGALTLVAENNNESATVATSRIAFRAQAGVTYRLAVAGNAGASGTVALNWSLTEPLADLAVTMGSSPNPVIAGNDVTYTASIVNNGPNIAEAVLLSFVLPATATVRSTSAGCTVAVGAVACSLGNMAVGQILVRQVVVATTAAGVQTLSVSVDGAWGDAVLGNDSATGSTLISPAGEAGGDNDVPLPAWSLVLLAAALWRGVASRRD